MNLHNSTPRMCEGPLSLVPDDRVLPCDSTCRVGTFDHENCHGYERCNLAASSSPYTKADFGTT